MIPTAMLALVLGCGSPAEPPAPDPVADALAQPLPDDSIYQLEVALEAQDGSTTTLGTNRGHPTIVSMFYASCPMACPMLIQEVQALESQLPPEDLAELRILLVSLDPKRDSPEKMTEVVGTYGLDTERWTLTRTEPESVREIAAVLGIQYRALDDGEMNHSSILTLVDRHGRIQAKHEGLGRDSSALRAKISAL